MRELTLNELDLVAGGQSTNPEYLDEIVVDGGGGGGGDWGDWGDGGGGGGDGGDNWGDGGDYGDGGGVDPDPQRELSSANS